MKDQAAKVLRRFTAGNKTWHDIVDEAQEKFMGEVVEKLAKELDGKSSVGAFGSGSVTYGDGKVLRLGFKGGNIGTFYIMPPKGKRLEQSVVNHTSDSIVTFLMNTLFKSKT